LQSYNTEIPFPRNHDNSENITNIATNGRKNLLFRNVKTPPHRILFGGNICRYGFILLSLQLL